MKVDKELRNYFVGFGLATLLTVIPFSLVAFAEGSFVFPSLVLCAVAQLFVHLRFFLQLSLSGERKEDLHLVLFTGFILLIMIGGTLGVLGSLYNRM